MRTKRTTWFVVAALCVAAAVVVLGGRSILAENLGDASHRALILGAYVLLAGGAGSLTRAFSIDDNRPDDTWADTRDGVGPDERS